MARQTGKVELRIVYVDGKLDVHFWHEGQAYTTVDLDGGCEEYFIGDDTIPESLCAWATLEVVERSQNNEAHYKIAFQGNGLRPEHRVKLDWLAMRANAVVTLGFNTTMDITGELEAIEWDIYLYSESDPPYTILHPSLQ